MTRYSFCLFALLLSTQAGAVGLLNDTGQTQCDNGSNVMAACDATNTGDGATYKRQDGRFGRDRAAPAKVGGGVAGFDFTKVCMNGSLNCAGAANITASPAGADWACTKDNVTNLIWSLQTQGNVTWNAATVVTYPDAGHNTANRCGFATGWRLPTRRELLGIVLNGSSSPAIDTSYFPSTVSDGHLTSDTYAFNGSKAWFVNFVDGSTVAYDKANTYYVRLVRSGQ